MVQHQRFNQGRKGNDVEEKQPGQAQAVIMDCSKKARRRLLPLLLFFALTFITVVFSPSLSYFPFFYIETDDQWIAEKRYPLPCPSGDASDCLYCDRTGFRSDICYTTGDIRTHSPSSSLFLLSPNETAITQIEQIKPYTRKWETSIMDTIQELRLIKRRTGGATQIPCETRHSVPAVFFSTGGYTGNVYHEFNDGIIPLYITSRRFNKRVVFVILEYRRWWMTKYGDIISRLSDYPPIDLSGDPSAHCFSQAIVGLEIHGDLTIDASLTPDNHSIRDFRELLDDAYGPRIKSLIKEEEESLAEDGSEIEKRKSEEEKEDRPKLVILSRDGSRAITNEAEVVKMAEDIGFDVDVLKPDRTTELAKIYRALNRSDVMVGVHGAAMTHFLFMRPGSVFIQIVPIGTDWAAETYYGEPAVKMGLKYLGYKIWARESSLYGRYGEDDPVLRDPKSLTKRGWQVTKRVYLDEQNVNLDLGRFKKRLMRGYRYSVSKRTGIL